LLIRGLLGRSQPREPTLNGDTYMKYKSDKERIVLESLIEDGIITATGQVTVTDNILSAYSDRYNLIFGKKSASFDKGQIKFFKKMAALTFMRLNESRLESISVIKNARNKHTTGFLYLISNPVYPGYYKVGITKNVEGRLASYQTYDPLRRFKVEHYTYCDDIREEERRIIKQFSVDIKNGEWVKSDNALSILRTVKSMI
jgi:hypothetical protein